MQGQADNIDQWQTSRPGWLQARDISDQLAFGLARGRAMATQNLLHAAITSCIDLGVRPWADAMYQVEAVVRAHQAAQRISETLRNNRPDLYSAAEELLAERTAQLTSARKNIPECELLSPDNLTLEDIVPAHLLPAAKEAQRQLTVEGVIVRGLLNLSTNLDDGLFTQEVVGNAFQGAITRYADSAAVEAWPS